MTAGPKVDCRPQLVMGAGSDRAVLAEFDSWIEPLQGMFARVLAENLTLLLGTHDVLTLPQRRPISLDYQIEVEVTRFDVDTVDSAVLDARWWCSAGMARGSCGAVDWSSEPTQVGDYTAAAGALSRARGAMSLEIAQALADQARNPR